MQINTNHQLELLHDILDEHLSEADCNITEYSQIKRLVQSMISKNKVTNENLLQQLPEMYHYGWQGERVQNTEEHTITNQQNIEVWLETINQVLR
ncbi:hypothetical protein FHP05_14200 [Cerasibacillus terrae]|uniref:Uncharacterized protein n=1 Tax=Cerasibacillus terrae TaxID=2498845 RepID=A0A5C8NFJ1_9BACI|nr:YtzH-like family protein [Cerasibacillus terrae]TXL60569.1 hypothetical protein FHP05_14200 [Cerasibacillus terrae]